MKNIFLLIALILSIGSYGQGKQIRLLDTSATATTHSTGSLTVATDGISIRRSNYDKTGRTDTIKCVLLITDCDDCQSKSIPAYVVREQFSYYGWRSTASDYSDTWYPITHLDVNKKPLMSSVIIWQCKY